MKKVIAKKSVAFTNYFTGDEFELYTLEEVKDLCSEDAYEELLDLLEYERDFTVGYTLRGDGGYIQVYADEIK